MNCLQFTSCAGQDALVSRFPLVPDVPCVSQGVIGSILMVLGVEGQGAIDG